MNINDAAFKRISFEEYTKKRDDTINRLTLDDLENETFLEVYTTNDKLRAMDNAITFSGRIDFVHKSPNYSKGQAALTLVVFSHKILQPIETRLFLEALPETGPAIWTTHPEKSFYIPKLEYFRSGFFSRWASDDDISAFDKINPLSGEIE